jgi:hypothetical protein
MRVTQLRGSGFDGSGDKFCPDGNTCPTLHMSDRSTFVIQGYIVDQPSMAFEPGYAAVELPLSLLPELAARRPGDGVRLTDHATVVLVGPEVTDADALDQLQLPAGETAIEMPFQSLPELGMEVL